MSRSSSLDAGAAPARRRGGRRGVPGRRVKIILGSLSVGRRVDRRKIVEDGAETAQGHGRAGVDDLASQHLFGRSWRLGPRQNLGQKTKPPVGATRGPARGEISSRRPSGCDKKAARREACAWSATCRAISGLSVTDRPLAGGMYVTPPALNIKPVVDFHGRVPVVRARAPWYARSILLARIGSTSRAFRALLEEPGCPEPQLRQMASWARLNPPVI